MLLESPTGREDIQVFDIIFILIMATVCIITIGANLVVLATIGLTRKLHSVSSALVINMAACDLGVGVIAMPLLVTGLFNGHWAYSQAACITTAVLTNSLCIGSVWSVGVISLDRYLAICYCLRYSSWSTWRYAGGLVAVIWSVALLIGLSPFASWGEVRVQHVSFTCVVEWRRDLSYGIIAVVLCYSVPLISMCYCYCRIISVARKHARRIGDANAHVDGRGNVSTSGAVAAGVMFSIKRLSMLNFAGNVDVKSDHDSFFENDYGSNSSVINTQSTVHRSIRATIRLLGLIAISALCWIPYVFVRMDAAVYVRNHVNHPRLDLATYCFALAHSALNPFLYAIGSKHFRHATRKLLQWKGTHVVHKQNVEYISSYANFLRNLHSPTSEITESTFSFHRQHLLTQETSSTITESRPSSTHSEASRKNFLEVPRSSSGESVFVLPNSVLYIHEEETTRTKDDLKGKHQDGQTLDIVTEAIEQFVYDSENTANIEIRVDLVKS